MGGDPYKRPMGTNDRTPQPHATEGCMPMCLCVIGLEFVLMLMLVAVMLTLWFWAALTAGCAGAGTLAHVSITLWVKAVAALAVAAAAAVAVVSELAVCASRGDFHGFDRTEAKLVGWHWPIRMRTPAQAQVVGMQALPLDVALDLLVLAGAWRVEGGGPLTSAVSVCCRWRAALRQSPLHLTALQLQLLPGG
ncbi:hypothetical protein FOA52_003911 [Chlamydomonas sp. UWO 241]|nr:hypothetical protein FOA52_003911 [Chlamydomonas sp. UWO 241]